MHTLHCITQYAKEAGMRTTVLARDRQEGGIAPPRAIALHAPQDRQTRVSVEDLFFELVYVVAVTQLSHQLLRHLSAQGVLDALLL